MTYSEGGIRLLLLLSLCNANFKVSLIDKLMSVLEPSSGFQKQEASTGNAEELKKIGLKFDGIGWKMFAFPNAISIPHFQYQTALDFLPTSTP